MCFLSRSSCSGSPSPFRCNVYLQMVVVIACLMMKKSVIKSTVLCKGNKVNKGHAGRISEAAKKKMYVRNCTARCKIVT